MVDAAIGGVATWLGRQLVQEAKLLYGVKGKVNDLKDKLLWMESFLVVVQARKLYDSCTLGVAVAQVKGLAIESRSVIQNYMDKVAIEEAGWLASKVKSIQPRHEVDSDIDAIQQKMSSLRSNMKMFAFVMVVNNPGNNESINSFEGQVQEKLRKREDGVPKTAPIEGVDVIGIEKYVGAVVDELLDKGGIGKTTLAQAVFWNNDIRKHFVRISWIYVS